MNDGPTAAPTASGLSYILPLKSAVPRASGEMAAYLAWLTARAEVIVVDGSPARVFAAHAARWGESVRSGLIHIAPDHETPMGKVGGVLTGLRIASHERVIIADDDVRYDAESLGGVAAALDSADVVRPQNYFDPMPWHALWDTGRTLLNRVSGGDWPGTLGVRLSVLRATNGYDGRVMFENLELVRTVIAAGGRESALLDVYVRRRPSSVRHFWSQRVRQAYDELARPARFMLQLAALPVALWLAITGRWVAVLIIAAAIVIAAEVGRRRAGGTRVFPAAAPLFAPVWVIERAVCIWLALGARVSLGGVPYRGQRMRLAATRMRTLMARHAEVRLRRQRESRGRSA
ncbi:MAG TPA: hypothetical protein VF118_08460 [Gemmatimonadaceae bacterium]